MKETSLLTRFIIIFFIGMISVLIITTVAVRRVVLNEALQTYSNMVASEGNKINGEITTLKGIAEHTGVAITTVDNFEDIQSIINSQEFGNVGAMYLGFSNNYGLFSPVLSNVDLTQVSITQRSWYQQAMQANGDVVITSPYYSLFDDRMVFTVTQYIGEINNLGAVIAIDVDAAYLLDIVTNINICENSYAFLTDENGVIITHPNVSYIPSENSQTSINDIDIYRSVNEALRSGDSYGRIRDDQGEVRYIIPYTIPISNWTLYISIPSSIIYAEFYSAMVLMIAPSILVGLIAIIPIRKQLNDRFIKPLHKLTKSADKLSSGILEVDQTINSNDEIGKLKDDMDKIAGILNHIINDISDMANIHTAGDYEYKLDATKYPGVYRDVVEGVNRMTAMYVDNFIELLNVLESLGKGNFDANVKEYPGKLRKGNEIVNELIYELKSINVEVDILAQAILAGELSKRTSTERFEGDWKKIFLSLNNVMELINAPIQEASLVLQDMSRGKLNVKMTGEYQGDFSLIKNSMNNTITSISSYIEEISYVLTEVSQNNLTCKIDNEYLGDFVLIKNSINTIIYKLNGILSEIATTTMQVSDGASQLSASSNMIAEGVLEQTSTIDRLKTSIVEIKDQTEKNANYAENADRLSTSSILNAQNGNKEMENMLTSMDNIKQASNNISKIIKVIDDIAFQTNLLALNAAVEAARAGVHGKGFAVVAEEVRNLASKSQHAARETQEFIDDAIDKINNGAEIAKGTSEALNKISENISSVSEYVSNISSSSKEQAESVNKFLEEINNISEVVVNNSSIAEENAASAEELTAQSAILSENLSTFKLNKD